MSYESLIKLLKSKATENNRIFNEKLVSTESEILGCKNPDLRAVAKELKDDINSVALYPSNVYYEVDMIKGFSICYAKIDLAEKLRRLSEYLPTVDNWAVCDSVASALKVTPCEKNELWKFAVYLLSGEKIFVQRFGLDLIMDNFLDEEHIDGIFPLIDKLNFGEYYLDMGAAWLLSVAFVKQRDKTAEYIKGENNLTKFVRNKALQKVRESFRVSQADKELAKNMKI